MTEYLDIFDKNGNPTNKTADKDTVHKLGLWHKTAHVWIINSKNELLLRLRWPDISPKFANIWDIPSSGHMSTGETSRQAAIRETKEETGLIITEKDLIFLFTLQKIDSVPGKEKQNNEFVDVFVFKYNPEINVVITDGRESIVKYFPVKDLVSMSESDMIANKIYPQPYYKQLFEHLENFKI